MLLKLQKIYKLKRFIPKSVFKFDKIFYDLKEEK